MKNWMFLIMAMLSGVAVASSPSNMNLDWQVTTINQHLFAVIRNKMPDTPVSLTTIETVNKNPECSESLCSAMPVHYLVNLPEGVLIPSGGQRIDLGSVKPILGRDVVLWSEHGGDCQPVIALSIKVVYPVNRALQTDTLSLCETPVR